MSRKMVPLSPLELKNALLNQTVKSPMILIETILTYARRITEHETKLLLQSEFFDAITREDETLFPGTEDDKNLFLFVLLSRYCDFQSSLYIKQMITLESVLDYPSRKSEISKCIEYSTEWYNLSSLIDNLIVSLFINYTFGEFSEFRITQHGQLILAS